MKTRERLMGVVISVIISIAMGIVAAYIVLKTNPQAAELTPVPAIYISNILMSVAAGILVALFIPLGRIGRALTIKAHATPPSPKFFLLNALPISVGKTFIVSFLVSLAGVISARSKIPPEALSQLPPFPVMWLGSWIRLLLPTLILSYVLSIILSPVLTKAFGLAKARPGDAFVGPASDNAGENRNG